ncbi:MAG: T9SS type A sorting domain-containing protein [Bacteroidetes bacterium]|nr:T9SS type A sorting domain-containing protein [Bacteroidota bacterium]
MKKQFYILILIALFNKINAQTLTPQQREVQIKQEINQRDKAVLSDAKDKSTFVFEGEVIKSEDFYNNPHTDVYTRNTIKVAYLFKGELKDSLIELILQPYTYNTDANFGGQLPPIRENLPTGYKGIFYCLNLTNDLQNEIKIVRTTLQLNRQVVIYFEEKNRTFKPTQYNTLQFSTKDELYKAIDFYPPNYKPFEPKEAKTLSKKEAEDFMKLKNSKKKEIANKTSLATSVTYSFQNMQVTGTSQKYYEFDIAGYSSVPNTYLDVAQTNIDYAPAAFGNSVSAASNVTVSYLPTFPIANYPYLIKSDYATNALQVILSADFTTPNRLILPTTLTNLFHVKMKVICNQAVNLSFTGTTGGYYASTATSSVYTNFNPVNDNDFDGTVACALSITSFSPPSINGGRNEILTINGANFGAAQGSGYIQLKNANDGGATYIQLDADDYISWSNSQIKIKVPSYSRGNGTITPQGSPVGNGNIVVSNGTSTFTSASPLIVFYSTANYNETAAPLPSGFTYRKERIYATGNPSLSATSYYGKKFPIKIDSTSCAAFPGALACIKKAIKYWVCESKIPFVIVGDTTFPNSTPTNGGSQNVLDKVSTIRFSNFNLAAGIGTNVIGITYNRSRRCDTIGASKVIGTLPEFDIEFDLNKSWFCDTTITASKPANKYDLYEVALHELGHANLLKHNNDPTSIMYFSSIYTNAVPAGNRKIFLNIMDYLGGAQIITDSKIISYSPNCNFLAVLPENCSGTIGVKENYITNNDVVVMPNPFTNNLLISLDIKQASNINISITDVLGKTVKQFEPLKNVVGIIENDYNGNELNSGVYFIKIQINNDFVTKKIIKQ